MTKTKFGTKTFTITVDVDKAIDDFYYSGASSETNLLGYLRQQGIPTQAALAIYNQYYGTDFA